MFSLALTLFACNKGPAIDMWEMNNASHVFGYWNKGTNGYPNKIVELPILPNGNYPYNPSDREFAIWVSACLRNPQLFTVEEYERYMKERRNDR